MKKTQHIFAIILLFVFGTVKAEKITVNTLKELADYATKSGNIITMLPGVYQLTDYLSVESMQERHDRKEFQFITFSGDNNVFNFEGVELIVDNKLRESLNAPLHNSEFLITGSHNTLKGLTLKFSGEEVALGAAAFVVGGSNNILENIVLHVKGSFPYGYGDYLGKGKKSIVKHKKHSGILITGTNTKLYGCKVFMKSLGHAFFIQGGDNTYFKNCYAEGEIRATDEMLSETTGPAFDTDFASIYSNYSGEKKIASNYMKSLNECGFRTYSTGKVTAINCIAKNMRVGFALAKVSLKNCEAINCERGYYLNKAVAKDCRGDANYGPLIYLVGEAPSKIDLCLMPGETNMNVHAIATICGKGHKVSIKNFNKSERNKVIPIMLGYGMPSSGEISAIIPEKKAENIKIKNSASLAFVVGEKASNCKIVTNGEVLENKGTNIKIIKR